MGRAAAAVEGWVEPAAGELVLFRNPSIEGAESAWSELEEREDAIHWRKGALVHAVHHHGVYGHDSISGFAQAVGVSYSTMRDYAATYGRLIRLDAVAQATVLSPATLRYSHYRACNGIRSDEDYQRILLKAAARGWSTGKTAEAAQVIIGLERDAAQPALEPPTDSSAEAPVDLEEFRSRRELERENERLRAEARARTDAPGGLEWTTKEPDVLPPPDYPEEESYGGAPLPGVIPEDDPEGAGEPVVCPLCNVGYVPPGVAAAARHAASVGHTGGD